MSTPVALPPAIETPHPFKNPAEVEVAEAEAFAKQWGVSTDVSLARLRAQPIVGTLSGSLQQQSDITFGGLWTDWDSGAVLHIAVKNSAGTKEADDLAKIKLQVDQKLGGNPGIDRIEYHVVPFSYAELFDTQAKMIKLKEGTKLQTFSFIDVRNNLIRVTGTQTDIDALTTLVKGIQPTTYDEAAQSSIFAFASRSQPPKAVPLSVIYGGLKALSPTSYCTTGFAIWGVSAIQQNIRLTTAAHCDDTVSTNNLALSYRGQFFGGFDDYQWHAAPNMPTNYVRNLVWNGSYDFQICGQRIIPDIPLGYPYSKYGQTSGYGTGTIQVLGMEFDNSGTHFSGFLGGNPNVAGGDSGGPVTNGNYAVATINFWVPGFWPWDPGLAAFMPISRINNHSQYVVTWWIP